MAEKKDYDVFISYSHADTDFVAALAEKLRASSLRVWFDRWELEPGEPWHELLKSALGEARSVLVFIGPTGIGPWAQDELAYGLNQQLKDPNFRIIPILGPGSNPDAIPPLLRTLNYIDLRNLNPETFDRLVATLRRQKTEPIKSPSLAPKVFLRHAKEDSKRIEGLFF